MKIDKLDATILKILCESGVIPIAQIHSHPLIQNMNKIPHLKTISYRVKKIIENKVIENITITLNFSKLELIPMIFDLQPIHKAKEHLENQTNHAFSDAVKFETILTTKSCIVISYFKNQVDVQECFDKLQQSSITSNESWILNRDITRNFNQLINSFKNTE